MPLNGIKEISLYMTEETWLVYSGIIIFNLIRLNGIRSISKTNIVYYVDFIPKLKVVDQIRNHYRLLDPSSKYAHPILNNLLQLKKGRLSILYKTKMIRIFPFIVSLTLVNGVIVIAIS